MKTCRNINVHAVNTDICLKPILECLWILLDSIRKQTYQCCSTRENLSNHVPITTVGLILTKLG